MTILTRGSQDQIRSDRAEDALWLPNPASSRPLSQCSQYRGEQRDVTMPQGATCFLLPLAWQKERRDEDKDEQKFSAARLHSSSGNMLRSQTFSICKAVNSGSLLSSDPDWLPPTSRFLTPSPSCSTLIHYTPFPTATQLRRLLICRSTSTSCL